MVLRNVHIRMSEEQYDFICALAEGLNCSQAEVIRRAIYHSDMKPIVEAYRKRQGDLYLQRYIECGMDEETKKQLEAFGQDLNENTQQIRKIGANISALIRDVRNGKVVFDSSKFGTEFATMLDSNKKAMEKQGALAEKVSEFMGSVKLKVRV